MNLYLTYIFVYDKEDIFPQRRQIGAQYGVRPADLEIVYSQTRLCHMAKCTTTCFGPYWPSSGWLKRSNLGSCYMHCY